MVYSEKFVAVVVCNGKILREVRTSGGDVVSLPFCSDYGLRFKNLDSRKAVVSVQIDGEDVLKGNRIIVNGNDSIDLKGFMNPDGTVKNAFRFIKKTQEIVDHRGDKIDDGLIRIEWQWEKVRVEPVEEHHFYYHHHHDNWDYWWPYHWPYRPYGYPWYPHGPLYGSSGSDNIQYKGIRSHPSDTSDGICHTQSLGSATPPMASCNTPLQNDSFNINENEGITVKGAQTDQNWNYGHVEELETEKNTIIIRLTGFQYYKETVKKNTFEEISLDKLSEKIRESEKKYRENLQKNTKKGKRRGQEIRKPLFVDTKIQCITCGRSNPSSSKFCSNCGTALGI